MWDLKKNLQVLSVDKFDLIFSACFLQEMKDLKESISESYLGQLKELQHLLEAKEKELMDSNRTTCEQKHTVDDLNERLGATMQSCVEANEIINR